MATSQSTMDFLLDQIQELGQVTTRRMFGEFALYYQEKVVAFICDDQLFIKPTEAGRKYLGTPEEKPAYPGSKLYFFISGDRWEDSDWLCELIRVTASELPLPNAKKTHQARLRKAKRKAQ